MLMTPKLEMCLACLRGSKEASVSGIERAEKDGVTGNRKYKALYTIVRA